MAHKQILMNDVAIVLTMQESDRFAGQKHDGFVYLPNKEAMKAFEAHIQKHRSPENYSTIVHRELHSISSAGIVALADELEKDPLTQWMWSNEDYRVKLW